jgi:putative hydrolase of the HAD superfamily
VGLMKYDAIIFDLFGTLVDKFPLGEFEQVLFEMADYVGVPPAEYVRLWTQDTWPMRSTGAFSLEENIAYICRALDLPVESEKIALAVKYRFAYTQKMLVPRHDTVETLEHLRAAGYKIGLISDCSEEVPRVWSTTALAGLIDLPTFSCSVHLKKPDPKIYLLTCEGLNVAPERCLYIGDGGSGELSAATRLGMKAILIRMLHEDYFDPHCQEAENWSGVRISTLNEVLSFLE